MLDLSVWPYGVLLHGPFLQECPNRPKTYVAGCAYRKRRPRHLLGAKECGKTYVAVVAHTASVDQDIC
jgi:hypothetical protein